MAAVEKNLTLEAPASEEPAHRESGPFACDDKDIIKDGDLVVVFENHTSITKVKVKRGETFEHRLGTFDLDHFVGKRYGSRVQPMRNNMNQRKRARTGRASRGESGALVQVGGYATLLPLTPELWCDAVSRRTAIMFPLDNAMVVSHLHLKPGSVVVESGTGSGCLTNFLARAVAPHGRVHTFEFNKARVDAAKLDFAAAKLDDVVCCTHANVYENGFGAEVESTKADAVFLDLPAPWLALPHAVKVLRPFGRICTFSPCIEQVQRTAAKMAKLGFSSIMTLECLPREFRITKIKTTVPVVFQTEEEKAIVRRPGGSRGGANAEADDVAKGEADEDANKAAAAQRKRARPERKQRQDMRPFQTSSLETSVAAVIDQCARPMQEKEFITADRVILPFDRQKGHTGYLTFAYAPFK
ncbi:tRNA adenine58-N1-methyltransferase catalytic subunit TRM61 [Hondaea fermentalgiana]|uniref:tRNA (adenine(58)-N(1))-methyltransferase n=1 Tax=Hondaea fermentalgiana TaxID=2315210 RepID=A0A2R5GBA7_9STRA|nr:tRNA adenine58-N1-methyltransferase catalytic subunit TRM61 [Hondaea fermentalgiana]|eukprot:GBG24994.1 tRNA adenine58-N1-methyltransferase catalytic subunit TRM61 [Hondaea fermentalgiana]